MSVSGFGGVKGGRGDERVTTETERHIYGYVTQKQADLTCLGVDGGDPLLDALLEPPRLCVCG